MKNCFSILFVLFAGIVLLISCKKEFSCEGCKETNKPPIANAGTDQTIFLPTNTANLDGRGSTDPDNNITTYAWANISGPSTLNIVNTGAIQIQLISLVAGDYSFELTVTDADGLFTKDTVRVTVISSLDPPQQQMENLIFYFPDPTGLVDANNSVTFSFDPPLTLIIVKVANFPDGHIDGMWCSSCGPRCPISSDYYVEPDVHTSFSLPVGTYNWTAETKIQRLNGYLSNGSPFPSSTITFFSTIHKTAGTLTILPNDNCVIKKIVF